MNQHPTLNELDVEQPRPAWLTRLRNATTWFMIQVAIAMTIMVPHNNALASTMVYVRPPKSRRAFWRYFPPFFCVCFMGRLHRRLARGRADGPPQKINKPKLIRGSRRQMFEKDCWLNKTRDDPVSSKRGDRRSPQRRARLARVASALRGGF